VRVFAALDAVIREDILDYAVRHREVIRRFGRLPHRDAALGRSSISEEAAYLAEVGAGF